MDVEFEEITFKTKENFWSRSGESNFDFIAARSVARVRKFCPKGNKYRGAKVHVRPPRIFCAPEKQQRIKAFLCSR